MHHQYECKMKKILFIMIAIAAVLSSCNDYETYAEQTEKERNAIRQFISERKINVISEATFKAQGNTTDVSRNEFVLFDNTGVYMQIVQKGSGAPIAAGETTGVLCRFNEYNILFATTEPIWPFMASRLSACLILSRCHALVVLTLHRSRAEPCTQLMAVRQYLQAGSYPCLTSRWGVRSRLAISVPRCALSFLILRVTPLHLAMSLPTIMKSRINENHNDFL